MSQNQCNSYPRVYVRKDGKVEVVVYFQQKRFRLQNGKMFQIDLRPNSYPINLRKEQGNLLAAAIYSKIISGYDPNHSMVRNKIDSLDDYSIIKQALLLKREQGLSKHYLRQLEYSLNLLKENLSAGIITEEAIKKTLDRFNNATSRNNVRRNLLVLFQEANALGWEKYPMKNIKTTKSFEKLHRPISNIKILLEEIKNFDSKLYLCVLFTYGCLLRPHREIRELSWGDFSEDLNYIRLSGKRNKSKRNRIVPVPDYIRDILKKGEPNHNIFSDRVEPYNISYFKGRWRQFKKSSKLLEDNQTLYSFRHTGAIDIYKRTGSIEKLKTAMGHSNIMVSLTYLRGLDVVELREDDMPKL